jgi:hypothetical protein
MDVTPRRHTLGSLGGIPTGVHAYNPPRAFVMGQPVLRRLQQCKITRSESKICGFKVNALGNEDEEFLNIDDIVQQQGELGMGREDQVLLEQEYEEESYNEEEYPEPPSRVRQLGELLVSAGCVDTQTAEGIPDIPIENIITCNSDASSENSLYVCVPSEDGEEDGHDWADDAADLGAVAVLASKPLPDCLLPVVVVDDVLLALSKVAAEFYGRL